MFRSNPIRLPDTWMPWADVLEYENDGGVTIGTANYGANGAAIRPVIMPVAATIYSMSVLCTNSTGNFDIGVYDAAMNRLASGGGAAFSTTGVKTVTFTNPIRLGAGQLIYAAVAMSNINGRMQSYSIGRVLTAILGGMGLMASAYPLPDPFVPVTPTSASAPLIAFGVR